MADKRLHPLSDIQSAIYKRLTTYGRLQVEVSNRIYDNIPDNETFPYIVIGEDSFDRFDTHDIYGVRGISTIYVYDQSPGRVGMRTVKAIMGLVYEALHDQDIGVPHRNQLEFACSRMSVQTEDDNRTQQGIIEFSFTFGGSNL